MSKIKITSITILIGALGYAALAYADVVRSPFRTKTLTIGTSSTTADNVRLHRGASGLQLVPGDDITAEGADAVTLKSLEVNGLESASLSGDGSNLTNLNGANIQTGTVTATQLGTDSVNSDEIVTGAVTSTEILDGSITNTDINAAAGITYGKLSFSNNIVAGDIAAGAVGTSEIADLSIVSADISNSAAIPYSKLSFSNNIVAGDIAANAVGASELDAADTFTVVGVRGSVGSVGSPTFSFGSDSDTGIYRSATNTLGFAAGANLRMTISGTINPLVDIAAQAGTSASPSYSFAGHPFLGMYRVNSNAIGFSGDTDSSGTTNPSTVLEVGANGVTQFPIGMFVEDNGGGVAMCVSTAGTLSGIRTCTTSSVNVKRDIVDLEETATVDNLRPRRFNYKQGKGPQTPQIGLIAEEVAEYYPEFAIRDYATDDEEIPSGDIVDLNYEHMVGLLVLEIQKLKKRVAELESSQ